MNLRLHALAYIYDHLGGAPQWMRRLTPAQIDSIATLFCEWQSTVRANCEITPLAELEKREITRALTLLNGDIGAAAKALEIGKTTLYRKTRQWGDTAETRVLVHQAAALANVSRYETASESP